MTEKIQKVLANAGLASRRQIENWLREGRISVNGQIAKLGDRITTEAKVRVDGREVKLIKSTTKKTRILLYHKPEGEICSRADPENRPTVFDRLPLLRNGRWISIGRLDFNTSGVLLLTNDGELAHQLMHPSREIEREYAVRIKGQVSPDMLQNLKTGVPIDGEIALFNSIIDAGGEGSNHWYHVMVKEGRNRIVRKLWESQGVQVSRLIRVRFGSITLPRILRRGKWMELEKEQVIELKQALGHDVTENDVESVPFKPRSFRPNTPTRVRDSHKSRSNFDDTRDSRNKPYKKTFKAKPTGAFHKKRNSMNEDEGASRDKTYGKPFKKPIEKFNNSKTKLNNQEGRAKPHGKPYKAKPAGTLNKNKTKIDKEEKPFNEKPTKTFHKSRTRTTAGKAPIRPPRK